MFSRATLNAYIEKGLISEQTHPEVPEVSIYNYTQRCQYEQAWDEVTMKCRGLIIDWRDDGLTVDPQGKILSNPFPKFFNYDEAINKKMPIPDGVPLVYTKLDGWFGVLYWLNDLPYIATRGSFASTGAVWATEWFRKNVAWEKIEDRDWCHIFEIISPITKIVCNYDYEGLIWLTARHLRHLDVDVAAMPEYNVAPLLLRDTPVGYTYAADEVVKATMVPASDYETLRAMEASNQEGFVMVYPNGTRLKMKFKEYSRLHKLMTQVSAKDIWKATAGPGVLEALGYRGKHAEVYTFDEILDRVPDEFFKWVEFVREKVRSDFHDIFVKASSAANGAKELHDRKEQYEYISKHAEGCTHIAMKLLDGKTQRAVIEIYKMIEPKGTLIYKQDE